MPRTRLATVMLGAFLGAGMAIGDDIRSVSNKTFNDRVVAPSNHMPVVVEFYAEWCGFCRKLRPVLDSLAGEYDGRVQFLRVDVEAEPDVAERFGVDGVPVVYLFDAGLPLARIDGAVSHGEVKKMVDSFAPAP